MTYRETFQRHRRLLTTPIVVAVTLAFWTVAGSPKAYESSASVWVDSPPPQPTSLNQTDPSLRTPADQQQLLLGELLRTRGFRLTVGRASPLRSYLATNPSQGWGPSVLLGGLKAAGNPDARVVAGLGPKQVTSVVAGPQVLQLKYRGPTPEVAAKTLRALLNGFSAERARLQRQRSLATSAFYTAQADSARSALDTARAAGDRHAALAAGRALLRATRRAQQARADAATHTTDTGLAIIDPPRVPSGPVAGHKKTLMAIIGGLFGGLVISFLGLVALTPSRPSGWDVPPTRLRPFDDEQERERDDMVRAS